jgi:alkanesulfonate monooxygenase SsuD/methylene tetrahydromethanopterin reductase-like flavin-dependent oxidoreductase (luciferase family)
MMRVGFGSLTCQRGPGDARSDGERYREALPLAAEAERLGFDSVWLSEHHFFADGYTPSLLVQAAAIAARTTSITIGTGVLLPTFAWEGDYRQHIEASLSYYVSSFGRAGGLPETLIAGSPETVAEQMLAYEQAAGGALSYTAEFCWPGLDRGVLAEAMTVFAERVLPLLR